MNGKLNCIIRTTIHPQYPDSPEQIFTPRTPKSPSTFQYMFPSLNDLQSILHIQSVNPSLFPLKDTMILTVTDETNPVNCLDIF